MCSEGTSDTNHILSVGLDDLFINTSEFCLFCDSAPIRLQTMARYITVLVIYSWFLAMGLCWLHDEETCDRNTITQFGINPYMGCTCVNPDYPKISCTGLHLTFIPVLLRSRPGEAPPIQRLDYSYNYFHIVSAMMISITDDVLLEVGELDISHNTKDLWFAVNSFEGLSVDILRLRSNNMVGMPVLDYLPGLRVLDLTDNHIQTITEQNLAGLGALQKIHLAGNCIQLIDRFALLPHMTELREMDITLNETVAWNARAPADIIGVANLDGALGPQLTVFKLVGFPLLGLDLLIFFETLEILEISEAELTDKIINDTESHGSHGVLWSSRNTLETISLTHNQLITFPAELVGDAIVLEYLHLDYNYIRRLDAVDLAGLSSLVHLTISHNHLLHIEPDSFPSTLSYVDVSHNSLSGMQWNMTSEDSYISNLLISIGHNPWICSCDMLWFAAMIGAQAQTHIGPFDVYDVYTVTCSYKMAESPATILEVYNHMFHAVFGNCSST